jgi:hypothetical protein
MTRERGWRARARAWTSLALVIVAATSIAVPHARAWLEGRAPEVDELQDHLAGWAEALAPLAEHVPDVVLGFACPADAAGKPDPDLDFKFGLIQATLAPRRIARATSDGPVIAHEQALAELCRARGWPSARVLVRLSKSWAVVDRP